MVEVKCDKCKKLFKKRKSYIKKLNFGCQEHHYEYRKEFPKIYYNDNPPIKKTKKTYSCFNCDKEFSKLESQMKDKKNIFCSKSCRHEHDSKSFKGSNNPNFQEKGKIIKCLNCNKDVIIYGKRKETFRYCSIECRNKHWSKVVYRTEAKQKQLKKNGVNSMRKQKNKMTKPEQIVFDFLNNKNINFISQYSMYNKFIVDFYIPLSNIIIEVQGDYWHGNPLKYANNKLSDMQIKQKQKDTLKYNYLTEQGFEVHMIWEDDIYKKLDETMSFIKL